MSAEREGNAGSPGSRGVPPTLAEEPAYEEADVEELHRAVAREPRDPGEGGEPAPWWVWTLAILSIFWGGWYLGEYGGSFDTAAHVALSERDVLVSQQASAQARTAAVDPVQAGRQIYTERCRACHQASGRGLPGAFPPLIGSEWEVGPPQTVVRILLDGLQGPVQVAGQTYNGAMPAWGQQLSNQEIAAVATYVRQWKPNSAPPVDTLLVAAIRKATAARGRPWTAEELRAAQDTSRVPSSPSATTRSARQMPPGGGP